MKLGGYRRAGTPLPRVNMGRGGFTVVETMIVLAVTGVLFVSAVMMISGRQNRTQFQTAINGMQQQMQQLITETANGFYPQTTKFACAKGATAPVLTTQAAADRQGLNPGCIFLGKVVQFDIKDTDPQAYSVIPIIGNRLDSTNYTEASTLYGSTGSLPIAAAPGSTAGTNSTLTTLALQTTLVQGLEVVGMWYDGVKANATGTVGFLTTLPDPDGAAGVASGTQTTALYTVKGTALNQATTEVADHIYPNFFDSQPILPVKSVSICVSSGSTNQSGMIKIGQTDNSASSNLAVHLQFFTGHTC